MKVLAVIGHALAPGALVTIRKKSFDFVHSALAAASAKLSSLGLT
jgi:hypothetical protein